MCPASHSHGDLQPRAGISLDELSEAFAHAMGDDMESATQEKRPPGEPSAEAAALAGDQGRPEQLAEPGQQAPPETDDSCEISPRTILEAMLFVGDRDGRPLAAERAAELMRGVEPEEITGLVDELNRRYAASGCPYHIIGDRSGYRLVLRKAFHPLRNLFYGRIREARLSQAAIDVLAIVAYQQPLTSEQISRLRGKPSAHVLAQLVRRGLLRVERVQTERRTAQYFTTDRFLELFSLESLKDLPQSEDLEGQ
jgi:segregation and condensation protein B